VEKAFSEEAKIFGDQIVSDIKDQFIEKLKVTTWMDKSVVKLAIDKVHKIVQKIGYPTKVSRSFVQSKTIILTTGRARISWTHRAFSNTTVPSTLLRQLSLIIPSL
jgi:predicted metalloendopeptidase